jgi:hypothetical protein
MSSLLIISEIFTDSSPQSGTVYTPGGAEENTIKEQRAESIETRPLKNAIPG